MPRSKDFLLLDSLNGTSGTVGRSQDSRVPELRSHSANTAVPLRRLSHPVALLSRRQAGGFHVPG
jgi:hypothetical protein